MLLIRDPCAGLQAEHGDQRGGNDEGGGGRRDRHSFVGQREKCFDPYPESPPGARERERTAIAQRGSSLEELTELDNAGGYSQWIPRQQRSTLVCLELTVGNEPPVSGVS
jgi:hypothetical protein